MSDSLLSTARRDRHVLLRLNNPASRNALTGALMVELESRLAALGEDRDVRAIVLAAEGPVFSAGHDLSELTAEEVDEAALRSIFDACNALMARIAEVPQPVIAQVDGMATAAGCQLVGACDLAIASERARFCTPGVKIGLFCTTPMVELTRAISRKRAMEMLLTGRVIDAATAADWGLVNRVVPANELEEAVRNLAEEIADASPLTTAIGKQAFYAQIDAPKKDAYDYAGDVMCLNAQAADAQEGMKAFLAKRKPTWKGE